MKTIHLFASLGDLNKTAAGGGQTSARRLVRLLEGQGYKVDVVNRTIPPYTAESIGAKLHKAIGFVLDPFRYFFHLLFKKRKDAISMVLGYSGYLFPYYFLYVKIGKFLGYRTSIYIKGGFTEVKFEGFSENLKRSYRNGLKKTDLALYEGEVGANLSVRESPNTKAVWIPNYVENNFMPEQLPFKPKETMNLLYFGRIHPAKNVVMIVDVFDCLSKKFENINLTIVGSGDSEYEKQLDSRLNASINKIRIRRIARIEHEKLKEILASHHFFVFPSVEGQEGHSNSLNEAMSYGLVPIVSDNNFLPSIVGNERLVVHEMSTDAYAQVIMDVIENRGYDTLSHEMYNRVQKHFTQKVVEKNLKEIIESL